MTESLHRLANRKIIKAEIAASGQMRFDLRELKKYEANFNLKSNKQRNEQRNEREFEKVNKKGNLVEVNGTTQKDFVKNSMKMGDLPDNSLHLMISSSPYFDTGLKKPKKARGYLARKSWI